MIWEQSDGRKLSGNKSLNLELVQCSALEKEQNVAFFTPYNCRETKSSREFKQRQGAVEALRSMRSIENTKKSVVLGRNTNAYIH